MSSNSSFDAFSPAGDGRVTAVLGPTNTGKTHYALERMLAHKTGMIGLPLRLLAREIYDKIVIQRGAAEVALVTGEEKIIPASPRYWVATVEAMPLDQEVQFLAIDEVQLAADTERGRVFTSRLLHARGQSETLLLGSDTMRPVLQSLISNIQFLSRERFSRLSYSGPKKVTRLPRRTAIVAFSTDSVYAIAELIRRQRGGAAVVLGALSPRTRNAQAALYQNGEVDFLVATDAIGMGLNMDIDHVAFAATRKFDGRRPRDLTSSELAQIAGRAGRHVNDGSFGVTADCRPLSPDIVSTIENHQFAPVNALQWRTEQIDLSSPLALRRSLDRPPPRPVLLRARRESDEEALAHLLRREEIRDMARGGAALSTLWDICQIPDFRKISIDQHARLLGDLYLMLMHDGRISDDWLAPRINRLDRKDGDIDSISSRIAHIRTWTYLSHRGQWLENAAYWQERARAIEDTLSDALHEKLTQRFVDRRTSTLMKRLKDDEPLLAGVTEDGEVIVEGQFIGRLLGFEFIVDPRADGAAAKSLRAAGEKALKPELAARSAALANAPADTLRLSNDGVIHWRGAKVAILQKGPAPLRPDVAVLGLDNISANMRARVEDRLKDFVVSKIEGALAPLIAMQNAANQEEGENALQGLSKGVAFRLVENFGATSRSQFGDELKKIDQTERSKLRKLGMRFGEYTLFIPALLKPAPSRLLVLLWSIWMGRALTDTAPPKAGLVSVVMAESLPHAYYYAAGYRPSGVRAVRIDMLERLAGLIRTARNEAKTREGFEATPQMMSLVGCSGEDFEAILRSLGLRKTVVKRKIEKTRHKTALGSADTNGDEAASELPTADATEQQGKVATTRSDTTDVEKAAGDAGDAAVGTNNEDKAAQAQPQAQETTNDAPKYGDEKPIGESPATPNKKIISGADYTEPAGAADNAQPADHAAPAGSDADTSSDSVLASPAIENTVEEVEVALWRPAPRKTFAKPKPQTKQGAHPGAKKEHRRKSGHAKGGKFQSPRGRKDSGPMHEPRHRKTADPNSPFAVLAGLKSQLSATPDAKADKKPEKAE